MAAERPEFILEAFSHQRDVELGMFEVRLWIGGKRKIVTIDDRLPRRKGSQHGLLYVRPRAGRPVLWPCLLEKAVAKVFGSYEALEGGKIADGLAMITGLSCSRWELTPANVEHEGKLLSSVTGMIETALQEKFVVGVASVSNSKLFESYGIQPNHAHTVIGFLVFAKTDQESAECLGDLAGSGPLQLEEGMDEAVQRMLEEEEDALDLRHHLVILHDPHGENREDFLMWSLREGNVLWTPERRQALREKLRGVQEDSGVFVVCLREFVRLFREGVICRTSNVGKRESLTGSVLLGIDKNDTFSVFEIASNKRFECEASIATLRFGGEENVLLGHLALAAWTEGLAEFTTSKVLGEVRLDFLVQKGKTLLVPISFHPRFMDPLLDPNDWDKRLEEVTVVVGQPKMADNPSVSLVRKQVPAIALPYLFLQMCKSARADQVSFSTIGEHGGCYSAKLGILTIVNTHPRESLSVQWHLKKLENCRSSRGNNGNCRVPAGHFVLVTVCQPLDRLKSMSSWSFGLRSSWVSAGVPLPNDGTIYEPLPLD